MQLQLTQPTPSFLNAQIKPKVSSPAPSKIYGRPGSLSTDPIKSEIGMKAANQSQNRILTEPPPAHSYGRNYLIPQQPPIFDLPVAAPAPTAHSPGICMSSTATPNTLTINATPNAIQSKPLDLGISDRYRNTASTSPKRPTQPTQPIEPIALDVSKTATTLISIKCNASGSADPVQQQTQLTQDQIRIPTITMTPDIVTVLASPASNPSNPMRTHEMDDTSNSSNNSKSDHIKSDGDVIISNGTTNDSSKTISPTPAISQPACNASKNPLRTNSADGFLRSSSTNSSPVPSPNSAQSAPATPSKFPNDYEKQSSSGKNE